MNIVNKENYLTTKQIKMFIDLIGKNNAPRHLIVFESRWQRFLYLLQNPDIIWGYFFTLKTGIFNVSDQNYIPSNDTVELYCYYHNGKPHIRMEILKSLAYALRIRHYYYDYLKQEDIDLEDSYVMEDIEICTERVQSPEYIRLIEKYVEDFFNNNLRSINKILHMYNEHSIANQTT